MENRIIDIRACLDQLGASWQFGGSVTDGTEQCWTEIHWEDSREKPSWQELQNVSVLVIAKQAQESINQESLKYLADTDWYVIRLLETGSPIPEDILTKRQEARDKVVR